MKKIIIQAGHEGTTTGATGAPNEQSFNIDISNKVADALRAKGFEVKRVNANPTDAEIAGDWDLFLAIHYDADIYGTGGGFVDFPEPTTDGATAESQRIAYLLRQEYFGTTKIISHPERSNGNTRYYYMWSRLSAKTPCVLIECGVGMHVPDDHETLHFNRPLVVDGLVKGICLAFNVPYELPVPKPQPPAPAPVPEPVPVPVPTVTPPSQPTTPPVIPPTVTPETPVIPAPVIPAGPSLSDIKLSQIRVVVYGKGWPWTKINKIKVLLPNQ